MIQITRREEKSNTPKAQTLLFAVPLLSFFLMANAVFAHGSSSVHSTTYPVIEYGKGQEADWVKKGEYLAKLGGCISCHTQSEGKPFAGGHAITTPFGTYYTPNITPDLETGIGTWSDDDFIQAMHQGISPSGKHYFPVFPYLYFQNVTTGDLRAIRAYLSRIPPVWSKNKAQEARWPFNSRFLVSFWNLLYFHPPRPPIHGRGAYLVEGLGHCGMCHTPTNAFGAPIAVSHLTGNQLGEGYYAPNISASALSQDSTQSIDRVFTDDQLLDGGGRIRGPMAEVNHNSLKALDASDLADIARYLRSVQNAAVSSVGTAPKRATLDDGRVIYEKVCSVCHEEGKLGAPKTGDSEAWAKRRQQGVETLITRTLTGVGAMPEKGACNGCRNDEVIAAVVYLLQQSDPKGDYSLWLR